MSTKVIDLELPTSKEKYVWETGYHVHEENGYWACVTIEGPHGACRFYAEGNYTKSREEATADLKTQLKAAVAALDEE